jgi:hypothetical protein
MGFVEKISSVRQKHRPQERRVRNPGSQAALNILGGQVEVKMSYKSRTADFSFT